MAVFIIRNWLAAATLSEHYMNILYHRENTLSGSPFEMFPFPSQGVFEGQKSTMAHIDDLPRIFQVKAVGFI